MLRDSVRAGPRHRPAGRRAGGARCCSSSSRCWRFGDRLAAGVDGRRERRGGRGASPTPPSGLLAEWLQALDQLRARWTFRGEVLDILRAVVLLAVSVFSLLFLSKSPEVSRLFLVTLFLAQIAFSVVERGLIRLVLLSGRQAGIGRRNILVVGTNEIARYCREPARREPECSAIASSASSGRPTPASSGRSTSLRRSSAPTSSTRCSLRSTRTTSPTWTRCPSCVARWANGFASWRPRRAPTCSAGAASRSAAMRSPRLPMGLTGHSGLLAKRAIDVAAASMALVLLAPILVAIALAVRLEDGGPVLFRQGRVGRNGRDLQDHQVPDHGPAARRDSWPP